jgi:long-chain acyl-CoA synthetase
VIPVGITGADKVLPVRSFKLDTRYHITVKIGKPFSYKKADDEDISPELLNQTRQEIMNRVYSLVYYRNREEDKRVQEEAPAIKIIDPVTAPITISDILRNKAKETPSSVGFWKKSGGAWLSITWSDYLKKIEIIAANLSSLGIKKGDKAIIISNTRHEWEMAEKAFLLIGVVVCGIDPSMSAKEMSLIADKVEPSVIVAENNDILEKIPSGLAARQKAVILIENKCGIKSPEIITWESIAVDSLKSLPAVDIRPDDTAAIIYTSGSSGEPKMIAYRHRQLVKACLSVSKLLKGYGPGDRAISWLPLAYMTSRMFNLSAMHAGVQLYYISDVTTLSSEMKAVRPTIFIGVPRFFEKVYDAINRAIDDQPIYVRGLVRIAIRLNKNRKRWGVLAEAASRFFLERIRSAFGGDLKLAISGSAPLARHILNFFAAIGIPVFEAYAMSENAIPMTMNSPYRFKFGTVGLPLDGNEIRFAEDGEILVKSSGVFEGYYRDEAPRPDIFDKDGFLRTGDLGYLDKDGFLILTGRKKEIIKTSTGNRVSPIEVESAYGGIPYIENIVIIGNERKYITAVLTINKKNVAGWCVKNMVSFKSEDDLWALPEVRKLLEGAIEQKHGELAGYKQVKKFAILSGHFSADTGELTTNLKIRRSFIESKYSSEIERMYSS